MTINTKPVSVLLVDDDEINNFISIKLIKKALLNTEIMACLNGKFAIDQLAEIQRKDPEKMPDYILLDINMPIMDGFQFIEAFKKLEAGRTNGATTIVIVTSSADPMDVKRARAMGVQHYLNKPMKVDDLVKICTR